MYYFVSFHGRVHRECTRKMLRRGLESPYAKIFEERSKQRGDDWKELITTGCVR